MRQLVVFMPRWKATPGAAFALAAFACSASGAPPLEQPSTAPAEIGSVTRSDAHARSAPTQPLSQQAPTSGSLPLELEALSVPPARASRGLPGELEVVRGLAPPPVECRALTVAVPKNRARACGEDGGGLERLAWAVELEPPGARDLALAKLESCAEFAPGLIRTLRADLMRACADALVAPYLRAAKGSVDTEVGDAMLALALSARWARAASKPSPFVGDGTESEVARYHTDVLLPWKRQELAKLLALEKAQAVVSSSGYASVIVALAAERAFRRIGWLALGMPIPERLKKNYETRTRYYAALDAALADVRARAEELEERASALLSTQGIHRAPDADARYHPHSARAVFGNRDDGYWGLLLVEPPASLLPLTATERVAARVPSFYTDILLGEAAVSNVRALRLSVESGLSPRQRYAVSSRKLEPAEAEVLAYFRAMLAQRTRDARQWDEAVALLEPQSSRSAEAELLLATARAARTGPRNHRASKAAGGLAFDVGPLERFSQSASSQRLRAFALNNAARLLSLSQSISALEAARALLNDARALTRQSATHGCIPAFESMRFVREPEEPCDLPTLP